jgi:hypothetical protein
MDRRKSRRRSPTCFCLNPNWHHCRR